MAIDEKKFLADQKWKADLLINANKDTKVAGNPTSSPFSTDWWYDDPYYDDIESYRGQPFFHYPEGGGQGEFLFPFTKIRGNQKNDLKIAHHLKDHFQDVPPQEILRRHITGEQPLSPEDLERIFGPDYEELIKQQQLQQSLRIGDPQLAKTPNQQAKSDVINSIKKLTKEGKHNEAQALYKEQFKV